jgi:hypothetical protein
LAYGLYLSLDQKRWFRNDFSATNKITGTLYTDVNQTVAKNLTGYTVTIKLYKPRTIGDRFNKTATIVTAADETFEYAVGEGEMPIYGLYWMIIQLTKSGDRETTLNDVEFQILEGPNA